jgi:hypothetical protein
MFLVESVEGPELTLSRLTRADMGAYLCIAANGIPSPVSKRIMVHVHCELKELKKTRMELKCGIESSFFDVMPYANAAP